MSEEKTVDIESMSSKEALGYFLPKVDEDARKAKKEGRPGGAGRTAGSKLTERGQAPKGACPRFAC